MNKTRFVLLTASALICFAASNKTAPAQSTTTPQSNTTLQNTAAATTQSADDKSITARYVLGEVTEHVPAENRLTLRTPAGNIVAVALTAATVYKRVAPGEKTLTNATPIAATELGVGDSVMARGTVDVIVKAAAAREVIVMTRADLTARREREQAEWRRGIVGTITAINSATKELTVQPRTRAALGGGAQPLVVEANSAGVIFRRYAPDSVRFQDAKTGDFAELKVGDQVRARGERSPDNLRFTPKEIVSGSFRTVVGTITAIASDGTQATLTPTGGGKPVTVRVKADSTLRRLPEAGMMGMMGGGAAARPGMASAGQGNAERPQGTGRPQGAGGAGGGMGGGGRGVDVGEMLERLPQLTLAELKPGDMVIVSSTATADPTQLTAIAMVAGVERFIQIMQAAQGGASRPAAQSLGTGLPGGIELGIGGP